MIDLIPIQFRMLALVIALGVATMVGAAGGAITATWKAESGFADTERDNAKTVADLTADKVELAKAVEAQTSAVHLMAVQARAADDARAQAQEVAKTLGLLSTARMDKLEKAMTTATTAGEVVKKNWELHQ